MAGYEIDSKGYVSDAIRQLRCIKEFPAVVHIYDRVLPLDSKGELTCLIHGLEVGCFITEENMSKGK